MIDDNRVFCGYFYTQKQTEEYLKEIMGVLLIDVKRKIPGFFMRIYDSFIFRLIRFLIVLNNTFTKSKID
jgi:hypothetical protein